MFERIKEIIADQLGLDDIDEITMTTSLVDDLEAKKIIRFLCLKTIVNLKEVCTYIQKLTYKPLLIYFSS